MLYTGQAAKQAYMLSEEAYSDHAAVRKGTVKNTNSLLGPGIEHK